jgi:hypothetical protein
MIAELKDLLVIPHGTFYEVETNLLKIRTSIWNVKGWVEDSKPWDVKQMKAELSKAEKLIQSVLKNWST